MTTGAKIGIGVSIAIVAGVTGLIIYRQITPPKFLIEEVEGTGKGTANPKINGKFSFGRYKNQVFSNVSATGVSSGITGRRWLNLGWSLTKSVSPNKVLFELYRYNKKIKTLEVFK